MDRKIVYPGAIPLDTDVLSVERNVMIALGWMLQAMFGTNAGIVGLPCTPTTPASMTVNVGAGAIWAQQVIDQNNFGSLAPDTSPLMKMGILPEGVGTSFTLSPPSASGQSINYLVEAAFQETDTAPVVLPYVNPANPSQPYSGPGNSGSAQNTIRAQTVQLQLKAGTPANTGTQTTPPVDGGYVGLYVITVNYGQTTVTAADILGYPSAPFIGGPFAPAAGNASQPFFVGPGTGTQALQAQQALALLSGTLDTFLNPETPFSLTNGISGDAVTIADLNNPPLGWGTFGTGTKNIPPGLTNPQGGTYTFLAGQGAWLTQILYPVVATDGVLIRTVISSGTPNVWGQFSQIGSSNQKPLSNVIASNAAPPSLEAALTAPCAGVVNAYSSLVFGSPPKTGTINVNLTLNGTAVDGDVCSGNVVHFGTAIVTAGQLCTAQINVTENSVGENYSARVLLTFTPNGNIAP